MRKALLTATLTYLGLLVVGALLQELLPTSRVGGGQHACYLTNAVLPYVGCRGFLLPLQPVLNVPYLVFLFTVMGIPVSYRVANLLYLVVGMFVLWAPIAYLAWQRVDRFGWRLGMLAYLLGIAVIAALFVVSDRFAESRDRAGDRGPRVPGQPASTNIPPELWSGHKRMSMPAGRCAEFAQRVLSDLGYAQVVRNEDYSYGNFKGNRAAVKCFASNDESLVYFAVAGPRRDEVEQLRDSIAERL